MNSSSPPFVRTRVAVRNVARGPTACALVVTRAYPLHSPAAMRRALLIGALLASCSSSGDGAYDYASSKGAALYQDQCQVCHGETGEGGLGPALRDSPRSEGELTKIIAMRMPANNPGQCTGECASDLAAFIKDGLTTKALA